MISGLRPDTPLATMRASGVMPSCLGLGVAHHDHRGGAVVERAGVAGRHGPALAEDRLQAGEALEGRAGPRAVVLGHHRAVGERDRDDLALEEAVLLRLRRPGSATAGRTRPSPRGSTFSYSATFSAVWPMAM